MTTPILGMDELAAAQSQPEVIVNAALRSLEAAMQISALGYQNSPPGSPAEGDRYLVGSSPTGAWTGHAEEVAYYSGGWQFLQPLPGWRAYVVGDAEYVFDESSSGYWLPGGPGGASPYDVGAMISGVPDASAVCLRYKFPREVTFAAGLAPSQGVANVAATADTDFDIQHNGVSVGTMTFATAATAATFDMASETVFDAGDVLTVIAPSSPDATLADISFVLAGTR
jgi:hypothetical protein